MVVSSTIISLRSQVALDGFLVLIRTFNADKESEDKERCKFGYFWLQDSLLLEEVQDDLQNLLVVISVRVLHNALSDYYLTIKC